MSEESLVWILQWFPPPDDVISYVPPHTSVHSTKEGARKLKRKLESKLAMEQGQYVIYSKKMED